MKFQNCALLNPDHFIEPTLPNPKHFITMVPAEIEDITIYELIRKRLQPDEDAQKIMQAIQNGAHQVRTLRGKLKL